MTMMSGRDEKRSKMDVDQCQQASTVDQVEKCSLVDVIQEKCSGGCRRHLFFGLLWDFSLWLDRLSSDVASDTWRGRAV